VTSWFDTHLHLEPDDEAAAILDAARAVGVEHFVLVASTLEEADRLHALAAPQPQVCTTVGLHPHEAARFAGDLAPYRERLARPRTVAVGEIGLDYHYDRAPRDVQRRVFQAFLKLAAETGLPCVIHCREACDDCLALLDDSLPAGHPFELHSYTDSVEGLDRALSRGARVSFNGIVTFRNADNVRAALAAVPLDRLLLETDSPYLTPHPRRRERNQPACLPLIGEAVARLKGVTVEALARATTANALAFFRLGMAETPR